jgi:hypothetical protein
VCVYYLSPSSPPSLDQNEKPKIQKHQQGFYKAVDWSERWIQCLLGFHVVTLALALLTRKSESAQSALFLLCMGLAFGAERINSLVGGGGGTS